MSESIVRRDSKRAVIPSEGIRKPCPELNGMTAGVSLQWSRQASYAFCGLCRDAGDGTRCQRLCVGRRVLAYIHAAARRVDGRDDALAGYVERVHGS